MESKIRETSGNDDEDLNKARDSLLDSIKALDKNLKWILSANKKAFESLEGKIKVCNNPQSILSAFFDFLLLCSESKLNESQVEEGQWKSVLVNFQNLLNTRNKYSEKNYDKSGNCFNDEAFKYITGLHQGRKGKKFHDVIEESLSDDRVFASYIGQEKSYKRYNIHFMLISEICTRAFHYFLNGGSSCEKSEKLGLYGLNFFHAFLYELRSNWAFGKLLNVYVSRANLASAQYEVEKTATYLENMNVFLEMIDNVVSKVKETTVPNTKEKFNEVRNELASWLVELNQSMYYDLKRKTSYSYDDFLKLSNECSKCENIKSLVAIAFKIPKMFAEDLKNCSNECKNAYENVLKTLVELLKIVPYDAYKASVDDNEEPSEFLVDVVGKAFEGVNGKIHKVFLEQFSPIRESVEQPSGNCIPTLGKAMSLLEGKLFYEAKKYFAGEDDGNMNVDISFFKKLTLFFQSFEPGGKEYKDFERIFKLISGDFKFSNDYYKRMDYIKTLNDMFYFLDFVNKLHIEESKKDKSEKDKKQNSILNFFGNSFFK